MKSGDIELFGQYFHTPARDRAAIFQPVLTAGHARLGPRYALTTWARPGHDLVLGVEGYGAVEIGGRSHRIEPGQIAWADCNRAAVRWPLRSQSWTLYWMRIDSPQMGAAAEALGVPGDPLFTLADPAVAISRYEEVLATLRQRRITMDAQLNASVAALVACLFDSRFPEGQAFGPGAARELETVLTALREDFGRRWTVRELADMVGVSEPQFYRRFRQATGSTPLDYLRRERINAAKRSLTATHDAVADIAEEVGYQDPYYFSRDFKKLVGLSPRAYRRLEQTPRG